MGLKNAASSAHTLHTLNSNRVCPEISMEVANARPWDVLFLVTEVASGIRGLHFNETLATSYGQRQLAWYGAKLLLSQLGFKHFAHPGLALAARIEGSTIGMIATSVINGEDDNPMEVIELVVVQDSFRSRGIGKALVDAVLLKTSCRHVRCYCAPESRAMQRILKEAGFRRTGKPSLISNCVGQQLVFPATYDLNRR